ncbi:MAG: NfeD family protein [Thiomicrorhabdus sp.]|nr:NfeD family protein [Thiomicrorhabdus sp.]
MENILEVIPAWIMLTIGLALLGFELLLGTFVVLFFGLAFVGIGVLGFVVTWSSGEIQILVTMVLSGILVFALRPMLLKNMQKEDLPLETMQTGDTGIIVNHGGELRLMYKGTTWAYKNISSEQIEVGDEVIVETLHNNVASVKKTV